MEGGEERAMADKHPKHHLGSPNATASTLEKLPFKMQHGEKIVRELKPQFFGFMMSRALGSYVGVLGFIIFSIVALIILRNHLAGFLVEILILPLVVILLVLIISLGPIIAYGKSWYWITNHRVIGKRGFLGYSIDSIPLENVSDVVLDRTLLDRLLGLSSLIIIPMGSNARVEGNSVEEHALNPNFFPALTQETAMELQRVLFNLKDDLKKTSRANSAEQIIEDIKSANPPTLQPKIEIKPAEPQAKKSVNTKSKNN